MVVSKFIFTSMFANVIIVSRNILLRKSNVSGLVWEIHLLPFYCPC